MASAAALCADGCASPRLWSTERLGRGYVLILPGVENYAWTAARLVGGLEETGIDYAVEVNQWGFRPFGTFRNLRRYAVNRQKAATIADLLVEYDRAHPGRPIILLGYSGGGAMALFVAEALPPGFMIDRIVMLGPAVSPGYDIGPALSHCRRGIISFYSSRDWFMLGLGTSLFGTMDRLYTAAAGRVGFREANGELLQREGLTQVRWRSEWLWLGNDGSHDGWLNRAWARRVLAHELRPVTETNASPD